MFWILIYLGSSYFLWWSFLTIALSTAI
ncbi:hypothetical protein LINPERHAP1_LOCUS31213 [Linum perenne]